MELGDRQRVGVAPNSMPRTTPSQGNSASGNSLAVESSDDTLPCGPGPALSNSPSSQNKEAD